MIPGKFLSSLAKFQGIVIVHDFWFPCRLQKLHWALLGLVERFCTGRTVTTGLLSQEPPRHTGDCSAIHFTKNFLICSNQISEMFRSGHDCTSTSSARNPRYFRLQADVAIWVLRKVRVDTMLTRTWFHFCSRLHWRIMRRTESVSISRLRVSLWL